MNNLLALLLLLLLLLLLKEEVLGILGFLHKKPKKQKTNEPPLANPVSPSRSSSLESIVSGGDVSLSSSAKEAAGTARCKISEMQRFTNFSATILNMDYAHLHDIRSTLLVNEGAIVTSYATSLQPSGEGYDNPKTAFNFSCQIQSHLEYCLKNGYSCHVRSDSYRNKSISSCWNKVMAIMELLPIHPWVLYLDTDSLFVSPQLSPSIESLISKLSDNSASIIAQDKKFGWSGDFIFIRNTPIGLAFIQHLWSLRHHCPHCVGEQCGLHVALFDLIAHEAQAMLSKGLIEDSVSVKHDQGQNCCHPISHCEYPKTDQRNENHGYSVQGCVWNWQRALSLPPTPFATRKLMHMSYDIQMRTELLIKHPVKVMNCSS